MKTENEAVEALVQVLQFAQRNGEPFSVLLTRAINASTELWAWSDPGNDIQLPNGDRYCIRKTGRSKRGIEGFKLIYARNSTTGTRCIKLLETDTKEKALEWAKLHQADPETFYEKI